MTSEAAGPVPMGWRCRPTSEPELESLNLLLVASG